MLTIYRRHAPDCQFHGRKNQRSARANSCEKRCPIWVQGSLAGEKVRRSLNLTSWQAASNLIHNWNASGKIGVERVTAPLIAEAVSRFLADAEARGLRAPSLKKYRRLLEGELVPRDLVRRAPERFLGFFTRIEVGRPRLPQIEEVHLPGWHHVQHGEEPGIAWLGTGFFFLAGGAHFMFFVGLSGAFFLIRGLYRRYGKPVDPIA